MCVCVCVLPRYIGKISCTVIVVVIVGMVNLQYI